MRQAALPVYLLQAVAGASFFTLYSVLSGVYRIREGGLDALQLILVGTVLELSVFLFEIPTGVVADVYSRRLSILIGFVLIGVGFLLESFFPTFGVILLAQIVWGVGYTFTSGATTAWIVDEVGQEGLGDALLRGSQWGQAGALLAMGAGVWLGSIDLALPLRVAGAGYLVLALVLCFVMPERGFRPRPKDQRSTWASLKRTFVDGLGVVRASPSLLWILAVALLLGIASEPLDRLWELHLLENFELPSLGGLGDVAWFGMLQAAALLLGLLATAWLRRARRRRALGSLPLLFWFNAGVVGSIVVFALTRSLPLAVVAYCALSTFRRLSGPVLNVLTNQHIPSEVRATVLSMRAQSDALGQVAGGPALGAIARAAGVAAGLLASAVTLLPTSLVFRWALPRVHAPSTPSEPASESRPARLND